MVDSLDDHLRQRIIDSCEQSGTDTNNVVVPADSTSPAIFVKYGNKKVLEEARTQDYFYNLAQRSDARAPRVPKVLDAFSDHRGRSYFAMEYVPLETLHDWVEHASSPEERAERLAHASEMVAVALKWTFSCPLPGDGKIGPVGGGIIQHKFFCIDEAPMEFFSVDAFQVYVNEVWLSPSVDEVHSDVGEYAYSDRPCSGSRVELSLLLNLLERIFSSAIRTSGSRTSSSTRYPMSSA